MIRYLLILILAGFSSNVCAQFSIDGKPLTDEEKAMVKTAITPKTILSKTAATVCECVDSISIGNKNAKENSNEIKKCIDKEVVAYQQAIKLLETIDVKEGEKINVVINTNTESNEYKKYFFQIQTELMDVCKSIRDVVGMNNKENTKSVSDNSLAIKEYNKGNEYLRSDDYKSALPYYQRAVKIDSDFAFAWDNIGVCSRKLGLLDQALEAYEKSLKIDPSGITALQNIPLVYIGKKEYKKAIKCYENLSLVEKDNPEVFYGIGVIYYENLKDDEKALDYMCRAFNLYTQQKSPYRADAEKIINSLFSSFKTKGKEESFNKILDSNKISRN